MLPEDLTYHASWVDSAGTGCFQVMEAPRPELLNSWVSRWDDLIDFEIVPVLAPTDFWLRRSSVRMIYPELRSPLPSGPLPCALHPTL